MKPTIKSIRGGFTLVELLVVITIIGVLAGMSIAVVQGVRESARVSATHARISKLDAAITEMYEGYQYRRIDIDISSLHSDLRNPRSVAEIRMKYLCQTMRMEMPQNWDEVVNDSHLGDFQIKDSRGNIRNVPRLKPVDSPLWNTYKDAYDAALTDLTGSGMSTADAEELIAKNGSAELLYQIITNGMPEMREMFASQEIGDVDEDGLPEFLDAWGNPICFVRWAAAFPDSDRQPDIVALSGYTLPYDGKNSEKWGDVLDALNTTFADPTNGANLRDQFYERYADPLDPLQVRRELNDPTGSSPPARPELKQGWLLVPLIVSPGPDGSLGLGISLTSGAAPVDFDDPFLFWGMPDNYGGKGITYQDNIHNHRVQNLQW